MSDSNRSYKSFKQFRLWILMVLLLGFIICLTSHTNAQEDNDPWAAPVNLSLSGAATDPRIVIDSTGGFHVLWREDAANSFYYTHNVNGEWTKAVPVEVPFGTIRYLREELGDRFDEEMQTPLYNPELVATQDGRIHALWLDDDNNLYHSSVLTGGFANYDSWTSRELISDSVSAFSNAVDNAGSIHLLYVDKSDLEGSPAGIYYRRWNGGDQTWSEPVVLFESAYFRGARKENLNLQIMVGKSPLDESGIYVVLDNRPLEEVVLLRSEDRGASWQEAIIVDQRQSEDSMSSVGPSNIKVISNGEQLHMTWFAGHNSNCQLYHRWSDDGGQTWQPTSQLEKDFDDCPTEYWLFTGANNLLYLLASTNDGNHYLQAWNGEEWSTGVYQPLLSSFKDPITLRNILLNCHRFVLDQENNMVSVGCGSGSENEDIWLLKLSLGDEEEWFPAEQKTWSDPSSFITSENRLLEPIIFSGNDNLLHTFWISSGNEDESESNAEIYYSSWNGKEWSPEVPLIHLNSSQADKLNGIYDPDVGLFLLWRDPETNVYYYSSVKSEDILLPAEWSTPAVFPKLNPDALFSSPEPFFDETGTLNLVYAVPLNEDRGIYLMRAGEDHQTWSKQIPIVDAVKESWAMVDNPAVAQTGNGDIHVIFSVYSLQPEPVAEALYYMRSEDGGLTWNDAKLIYKGDIIWSKIVGIGPQTVLINWQEEDSGQFLAWSQQSTNNGNEWDRPDLLLERSTDAYLLDLFYESTEYPYLVKLQKSLDGGLTLQERVWLNNEWQGIEANSLDVNLENKNLLSLSAGMTQDDQLVVVFNTETNSRDESLTGSELTGVTESVDQQSEFTSLNNAFTTNNIFFIDRSTDLPKQITSKEEVAEIYQEPESVPVPTILASPTPENSGQENLVNAIGEENTNHNDNVNNELTSDVNKVIFGLAPVVLIVFIVFVIGLVKAFPKQ